MLHTLIAQAFAELTAAEVMARLDAARIANAQVSSLHGLWQHRQLAARQRWREIGSPAGPLRALHSAP